MRSRSNCPIKYQKFGKGDKCWNQPHVPSKMWKCWPFMNGTCIFGKGKPILFLYLHVRCPLLCLYICLASLEHYIGCYRFCRIIKWTNCVSCSSTTIFNEKRCGLAPWSSGQSVCKVRKECILNYKDANGKFQVISPMAANSTGAMPLLRS